MPLKTETSGAIRVFQFVFAALCTVLLASMLFVNNNPTFFSYKWHFWVFLMAVAALFMLFLFILDRLKASQFAPGLKKRWPLLLAVFTVVLFLCQAVFAQAAVLPLSWDINMLATTAASPNNPDSAFYFSVYPNNFFLLVVYRAVWRVSNLTGIGYWFSLALVNIAAVDVALVGTVWLVRRWLGLRLAAMALFLGTLLFALSPWLLVLYSDTFVLPYVVGALLLYDLSARAKSLRTKALLAALMGLCTAMGVMVKPTAILVAIAIAVVTLVRHIRRLRVLFIKQNFVRAGAFALAALCAGALYQGYVARQTFVPTTPGMSTPMAHYLMMGLSELRDADGRATYYGSWNEADVVQTHSLATTEEKTRASLETTLARWRERGFFGTLKFYFNKMRWFTADGTFFWGGESGENFMDYSQKKDTVFSGYIYTNASFYPVYAGWMQAVWVLTWLLTLVGVHLGKKHRTPKELLILQVTIVGILLFVTLFEGRSRYLFLYTPFFIMAAMYGAQNLGQLFSRFRHTEPRETPEKS